MRLYHGSNQPVRDPRIMESHHTMDFGSGFYTTQSEKQATDWARTVTRRRKGGVPTVTEYDYDESEGLKILVFDGPTDEWLDFVSANRYGDCVHDYDIILGPVADEGVYKILIAYFRGLLTKQQAIGELKTGQLDGQVLFHTDRSLERLSYVGDREVRWMEREAFECLLPYLAAEAVKLIMDSHGWDENTAISRFMNSEVYERLQDESAKVWHLSPLGLSELFDDELDGRLEWPEV